VARRAKPRRYDTTRTQQTIKTEGRDAIQMSDRFPDGSPGDSRELAVLTKRSGILGRLCEGSAHKRDLVDELDQSRRTIHRAINELEELELVERGNEGFVATVAGRLALDELGAFRGRLDDVVAAREVLDPVPLDAPIETDAVAGG